MASGLDRSDYRIQKETKSIYMLYKTDVQLVFVGASVTVEAVLV